MHMNRFVRRVLAAATTSACFLAPTPSLAFNITVNGATCSTPVVDAAGNVMINCGGQQPPAGSCTITPANQQIGSTGGTIALLTAATACGTGSWTAGTSTGSANANTYSDSLDKNPGAQRTFTYTYTGSGGNAKATVTQLADTSPPPPPSGEIDCRAIPGITATHVVPLPWATTSRLSTQQSGGFGPNDAVVFVLKPTSNTGGALANVTTAPTDGNSYNTRVMALSDTPCDLSNKLGTNALVSGQGQSIYFTVGGYPKNRWGITDTSSPNLTAGVTYYLTVVQRGYPITDATTCFNGSCNMNYGVYKP